MNVRKFRAAFLTLTMAASVAVPAAAAQTAPEERSETPAAVSERTTVRVINNNWDDVTVYAVRDGYRHRLGKLTSFTSRVFTLPPTFLIWSGELRLIADPIAPVGFSRAPSGRNSSAGRGPGDPFAPVEISSGLSGRNSTAIRGRRVAYVSEPLLVNAGDVVEWRLLSNIRLSNIFIHRFR